MRMPALCLVMLISAMNGVAATAHPHAGGIVVGSDGTVIVGDFLQPRLIAIAPSGQWREIAGVGHVRDLELAADGTIYGVSQGGGLWKLDASERHIPVLADYHGLFTLLDDGHLALAPADSLDRRPGLDLRKPDGRRSALAELDQIEALTAHGGSIAVSDGSAVRVIARDGATTTLADDVGAGLLGLASSPTGLIVSAYEDRRVVEITPEGSQRVLLSSEPPWAPTDVAFRDGAIYVVEYAQHPCCWKGPRVRHFAAGEAPVTLLTIDDGDHRHPFYESPWILLGLCITGGAGLTTIAAIWAARALRRRSRSRRISAATNP